MRRRWWFFIFMLTCVAVIGSYIIVQNVLPNSEHVEPDFGGLAKPIFINGEMFELPAEGTKEGLKLPLPFVQQYIDPNVRYEETSQSIILTTKDKLIHFKTDQLTGSVNSKPIQLHFAAEKVDGVLYLPIDPLKELYGVEIQEHAETGAVILNKAGDTVRMGEVPSNPKKPDKTAALRTGPTKHAPILADVGQGSKLRIWHEVEDWYEAQLDNGVVGFIRQKDVELKGTITLAPMQEASETIELQEPVHMIWEAVYNKNPDPGKFAPMPGVNVVSPTWFSLLDGEGNVKNKADPSYVRWAHNNNMQVWALFSNSFEPEMTTSALASFDNRFRIIQQLLSFAKMYKLDGFNIDFENVHTKDKDNLTQFMRELTPMMHEQGLVVSIDVTPKSNSEMWSVFLDRKALGEIVDFMMVMAYDEHWASSPKAGSVASLPWVERSIRRIIDEDRVPPNKLLLGMPFYTRIWTEKAEKGKMKVTSKAVGMKTVQDLIQNNKLTPVFDSKSGQNYVEYKENGATIKIWIEDEVSVKARLDLARKLKLAGTAIWTRSFASDDIWDIIAAH
ncbi:glycosyl hydrolase [Paenibacillus sp. MSJ-34]|nr:glycosyl hydrolase [Paenibacillus sp. MSJ-34]